MLLCTLSVSAKGTRVGASAIGALLLALLLGCGSGKNSDSNSGGGTTQPPPSLLARLSTDTFTNSSSQHATQVEPMLASFGRRC